MTKWDDDRHREWKGRQGSEQKDRASKIGYRDYLREVEARQKQYQAEGREPSNRSSGCWVATSYYGGPTDPNVQSLRAMREDLRHRPLIGGVVSIINEVYHSIGRNWFGRWWSEQLMLKRRLSPVRLVSMLILQIALAFSRILGHERRN